MLKLIETWNAKRLAVAELSRLSDRALADLGIARADIGAVAAAASGATEAAFPPAGHRNVPAWSTNAAPVAA